MVLLASLTVWISVFAGGGHGRSGPVVLLLISMASVFAVGASLRRRPEVGFAAVTVAIAVAGVTGAVRLIGGSAPPTGYSNANATLASLGVIAALGASTREQGSGGSRLWPWAGVAGVLFVATALTRSVAGIGSLVVALALLGMGAWLKMPSLPAIGGAVAVVAVAAATTLSAAVPDADPIEELMGVRADLWVAAVDIVEERPVRGIGVGEFARHNRVSEDADLRWVHHGYLQAAAEWGVIGLVLLLGLGVWLATLLAIGEHGGVRRMIGAAALTVVGLHGSVDYVWHAPAVMLAFAAVVGIAAGGTRNAMTRTSGSACASRRVRSQRRLSPRRGIAPPPSSTSS